jgi:polyisoprenoid-binding protein YceI
MGNPAGFTASTTINRRDYGVQFNIPLQGDDVLLGDMVEIRLEIQAVLAS